MVVTTISVVQTTQFFFGSFLFLLGLGFFSFMFAIDCCSVFRSQNIFKLNMGHFLLFRLG
jgi:hypothetical protein